MTRTLTRGGAAALAIALAAFLADTLGITDPWPVALAVAIALVPAASPTGRLAAAVVGAILGWVALALQAALLPSAASSTALLGVLVVVVVTGVAAVSGERLPLWAGLAGYALFTAVYLPLFEATPTAFLSESPVALVTVLLAVGLGALAAAATDLVGASAPLSTVAPSELTGGLSQTVRIPDGTREVL